MLYLDNLCSTLKDSNRVYNYNYEEFVGYL